MSLELMVRSATSWKGLDIQGINHKKQDRR